MYFRGVVRGALFAKAEHRVRRTRPRVGDDLDGPRWYPRLLKNVTTPPRRGEKYRSRAWPYPTPRTGHGMCAALYQPPRRETLLPAERYFSSNQRLTKEVKYKWRWVKLEDRFVVIAIVVIRREQEVLDLVVRLCFANRANSFDNVRC